LKTVASAAIELWFLVVCSTAIMNYVHFDVACSRNVLLYW